MHRIALPIFVVAVLAGCMGPAAPPAPPQEWAAVPGLDEVFFVAWANATGDGAVIDAKIRNGGLTTYILHSDCAAHWLSVVIRDGSGKAVSPSHPEIRCDLCSAGEAFPPGAQRSASHAWNGDDRSVQPPRPTPAGAYVAEVGVAVDIGGGMDRCGGGPFTSAALRVGFTKP